MNDRRLGESLRQVTAKASSVVRVAAQNIPVDLVAVARARRVTKIRFVDMLPDGGLVPVDGGFEIYLNSSKEWVFDVSSLQDHPDLTPRQRFTLAHELAHTFFFDLGSNPPAPLADTPSIRIVERVCNETAAQILIPPPVLRPLLRALPEVSVPAVKDLARRFNVSIQVMVRRLAREELATCNEALILAYPTGASTDAEVRAVCYGNGLLSIRPRPREYMSLQSWSNGLLPFELFGDRVHSSVLRAGQSCLAVRKEELHSRSGAFLLEFKRFTPDSATTTKETCEERPVG